MAITAFLLILRPTSFAIRTIIEKWSPNGPIQENPQFLKNGSEGGLQSLKNAGEYIGYLERTLILIFILVNRWEGVGFLLAAKSIFRFGDLKDSKDMKLTEYMLIGTLLSFASAIFVALIALHLMK